MHDLPNVTVFHKSIISTEGISFVSDPVKEGSVAQVGLHRISETVPKEGEKPAHEWGEVVLLVGNSTAGKSSIISELLRQRRDMIEDGGDLAATKIPMGYLEKHFSDDFAFFQQMIKPNQKLANSDIKAHILDYVLSENPIFKEGITTEEEKRYYEVREKLCKALMENIPPGRPELIIEMMMSDILENAKSGRSVVFDALQIEEVFAHALGKEHPSIKVALVYCPFQTLAERVVRRNKEAVEQDNIRDVRLGVFPLVQFTQLFRPKQNDKEEVIQTLSRKEAEESIDILLANEVEFYKAHDPKRLEGSDLEKEARDSKTTLLKNLGFKETDGPEKTVDLTPKFKGYQIVINTSVTDKSKDEAVKESVKALLFK